MNFLFPIAYAQEPGQTNMTYNLILFGGMFLLFYLILWRPQSKRAKDIFGEDSLYWKYRRPVSSGAEQRFRPPASQVRQGDGREVLPCYFP